MRNINLSDDRKRDALVAFEGKRPKRTAFQVMKDGSEKRSVRVLQGTLAVDTATLLARYGNLNKLGEAIINGDPEVDLERMGMIVSGTRKVYINGDNEIVYRAIIQEVIRNPDGSERERRPLIKSEANIATEIPLRWTGKMIPKEKAVRMLVFCNTCQIKHVSGLTYDFLYGMAKQLHEADSLMLIGAGKKGTDPLVFSKGSTSYRGFLEGRIRNHQYCLLLHLSNLELKELV